MNLRLLTTLFSSVIFALSVCAASTIAQLDEAISKRDYFIGLKEQRIDSLKNLLSKRSDFDKKWSHTTNCSRSGTLIEIMPIESEVPPPFKTDEKSCET